MSLSLSLSLLICVYIYIYIYRMCISNIIKHNNGMIDHSNNYMRDDNLHAWRGLLDDYYHDDDDDYYYYDYYYY